MCYCIAKCTNHNNNSNVHRILGHSPYPKANSIKRWITYHEKKFRREEILDACGLSRNEERKRLYVCDEHGVKE